MKLLVLYIYIIQVFNYCLMIDLIFFLNYFNYQINK